MSNKAELKVLIPAAGKSNRSGMRIPKTLKELDGIPIIVRILRTVRELDSYPTIVVSPQGKKLISDTLVKFKLKAELIVQEAPHGMGEAVLRFKDSVGYPCCRKVLVIWSDVPFVQLETLMKLIELHNCSGAVLSLPSIISDNCYTVIERDPNGRVRRVSERRELGSLLPLRGERDTGIFLFKKNPVMEILSESLNEMIGKTTGERGFLPVVEILRKRGMLVNAFPIATELDALGFNTPSDLKRIKEVFEGRKFSGMSFQ